MIFKRPTMSYLFHAPIPFSIYNQKDFRFLFELVIDPGTRNLGVFFPFFWIFLPYLMIFWGGARQLKALQNFKKSSNIAKMLNNPCSSCTQLITYLDWFQVAGTRVSNTRNPNSDIPEPKFGYLQPKYRVPATRIRVSITTLSVHLLTRYSSSKNTPFSFLGVWFEKKIVKLLFTKKEKLLAQEGTVDQKI